MSADQENDSAFNEKLIEDVLSAYPEKFADAGASISTSPKPPGLITVSTGLRKQTGSLPADARRPRPP